MIWHKVYTCMDASRVDLAGENVIWEKVVYFAFFFFFFSPSLCI